MIADTMEMEVAGRQLKIMEEALKALRDQLGNTNPDLLNVTEKAYIRRITELQADISHYLGNLIVEGPEDVCLTET